MINIGITGQKGFVGTHLFNTLGLSKEKYNLIEFKRGYFEDKVALDIFVSQCDVIVHLASVFKICFSLSPALCGLKKNKS